MTDFHDGKDAGALRTIGEVSEALDLKPHVLRYWEQQFPMLKPLKRSGGRRYYRADDIALVEHDRPAGESRRLYAQGRKGGAAVGHDPAAACRRQKPNHRGPLHTQSFASLSITRLRLI